MDFERTNNILQLFASRVSNFFDLKGPSIVTDVACASSLLALNAAMTSLRTGECEAAIVAGLNITIKPLTALCFHKMKMTSPDCACKVWDKTADGYARAEASAVILLQVCYIPHASFNSEL